MHRITMKHVAGSHGKFGPLIHLILLSPPILINNMDASKAACHFTSKGSWRSRVLVSALCIAVVCVYLDVCIPRDSYLVCLVFAFYT
jgi:hypothetical protein